MYNSYIVKRTQIYLTDDQAEGLGLRARARGTTSSKLIREAIDRYLAEPEREDERRARFHSAIDAAFGIAPYLPDGAGYVEELRRGDLARDDELVQRRSRSGSRSQS